MAGPARSNGVGAATTTGTGSDFTTTKVTFVGSRKGFGVSYGLVPMEFTLAFGGTTTFTTAGVTVTLHSHSIPGSRPH